MLWKIAQRLVAELHLACILAHHIQWDSTHLGPAAAACVVGAPSGSGMRAPLSLSLADALAPAATWPAWLAAARAASCAAPSTSFSSAVSSGTSPVVSSARAALANSTSNACSK